ncbi:hypothetical protein V501_10626 [Pseudogymnoascus sp. VKM F-4519 (FW-2642)]|nr:hypothetical protein V501_10626 [Pseudogymnoascus sp. VKM F-4519 (FW-2642)]
MADSPTTDKITDKIAALPQDASYFSLEFFPPKTAMGSTNLRARLDRMSRALRPLFVTVTWGAGGSTASRSMELAELCQRDLGLTTCLHLTCTNMSKALVDDALKAAKEAGIQNILALRGDEPRGEYKDALEEGKEGEDEFVWAIDLVKYIRKKYGDYFCVGVAAYPEGHADGSHPTEQSLEHDLPYLVDKVQAGADFIMTQLFYDVDAYDNFEKVLRDHSSGAFKSIPIIPGLMPIQSYQILRRTTKLSNAKLPESIIDRLDAVRTDDEMVKKVGVDILAEIVESVKATKQRTKGPKGFHFYTLNLEKAVAFILERVNLIPSFTPVLTSDAFAVDDITDTIPLPQLLINGERKNRRQSSVGSGPHNFVIIDREEASGFETTGAEAAVPKDGVNTRANTLAISEGEGALGREATWDDFPNGRWGDARSPAYGEIDGYGPTLHTSPAEALALWNHPTSRPDITSIFVQYLNGTLSALPWSDEPIAAEANLIKNELVKLNQKGWWTIASQPAVNGARSQDGVVGWGPKGGWVFQKAFVELFVPTSDWARLKPLLEGNGEVSFLAQSASGEFLKSKLDLGPGEEGTETNAVTWGVFPGKEIVSPTIVEEVSFRAWAEEAWQMWEEWAAVFGKSGEESRRFLDGVAKDGWLVNVIWHDFVGMCKAKEGRSEEEGYKGLWDVLIEA